MQVSWLVEYLVTSDDYDCGYQMMVDIADTRAAAARIRYDLTQCGAFVYDVSPVFYGVVCPLVA